MRSRTKLAVVTLLAAGLAVGGALAQGGARPPRVLHEDLPAPSADAASPTIGAAGSGANPAAFTAGDKVLPRPAATSPSARSKDEPVLGTRDFGADRDTSMTADRNTGPDGTLHYVSVFNPDVLPFKRMSAMDGVLADFTLAVTRPGLVEVPVGGTTERSRDRFWGSVLIELKPGIDVPLPSVAPDMRILSYEVKPKVTLRFTRDGADNFFVRSDDPRATGTYRLVFFADADGGYFAPALPSGARYTPRRMQPLIAPALKTPLTDAVRAQAQRTLARIGVDADMDLGVAFNKLVAYFRAFEAKALPPDSGNLYRDLCDSQAGVCRHRAFAFMITANALGIPTRYVQNEAHAFVEVWFPERNWQRVDLGGAALRMEVTGADTRTMHRPRSEDPFAKPDEYKNTYTQLEGDIGGLSAQQLADKKKPLDQAPASGAFDASDGAGSGSGGLADRILPDPSLPYATQDPKKQMPRLLVTTADASAFRGDLVHVEGRAAAGGKPIADHPVDVFLAPAGRGGANPIPLGRAVTDRTGRFSQDFSVPGALNLATYEIYLASPEDASYNAALSD